MARETNSNAGPDAVSRLWEQLGGISQLSFVARSGNGTAGWNGSGTGTVLVQQHPGVIVFRESGSWQTATGQNLTFRNVFRWTLDPRGGHTQLEHLRYGEKQPVFLFDLIAMSDTALASAEPHRCVADIYTSRLLLHSHGFSLDWYIQGAKKDEHICYQYS